MFTLKKIFFTFTFNLFLFLLLMVGIQNSTNKRKINLIVGETVSLPIGFVIGVSFICGSITGGLFLTELSNKKR